MIPPFAKAVGFGTGTALGAVSTGLLLLQAIQQPSDSLVGSLGLPGALASVMGAAWMGAKLWQTLKTTPVEQSPRYRDMQDLVTALEENIQRRHDELLTALRDDQTDVERRHGENMNKLQRIEDFLSGRRR